MVDATQKLFLKKYEKIGFFLKKAIDKRFSLCYNMQALPQKGRVCHTPPSKKL